MLRDKKTMAANEMATIVLYLFICSLFITRSLVYFQKPADRSIIRS